MTPPPPRPLHLALVCFFLSFSARPQPVGGGAACAFCGLPPAAATGAAAAEDAQSYPD